MAKRLGRIGWGPWSDWRGAARGLTLATVAALFLALSGAFGTGELPMAVRVAYWLPLLVLGTVWGAVVSGFMLHPERPKGRWTRVVVTALTLSAPFTLVVWAAGSLIGSNPGFDDLPIVFVYVVVVSLAMTVLNVLIESRRSLAEQVPPPPPRFLERLPLKLRGGDVWAVEAEDHYLRLHTSKGQDLILMRLADAVDELAGIEGAQVHRSWWVARDAITAARRGDGRATLTLKDGAQVPVSRTYAAMLREKGWI